ncbi:Putative PLC-like phosphodiesterase, TIM beta/alpha-barrel domain superfamily [Septoria linicola]|uniref:PLC-like phosphodiesterase, TIM beta/alpha-barrel domain superfamily n=1 Tax=Septoria linicola TaxID=215465 RepID=A0A9Q9B4Q1_9PEZI|nr:putative PLC-like phosphodiesterase, TIM beta/alpha-barrel domain superfamily [Septoria linicola]USW56291.1 Putative PLC-like phosphodiesterase, TIM beta/alpha-barrel domain superfamily [Septoria linicola]
MYITTILLPLLNCTSCALKWTSEQQPVVQPPAGLAAPNDPHPKKPGHRRPVPELYYKRYSEQTFIGTHDAAAVRTEDNGWSISGNQYFNVSTQLNAGVRLVQAQGHSDPQGTDDIRLCHFNCALMDGGSLHDHLRHVKDFLNENPFEVVTLLFVNTGPALRQWAKAYYDNGLDLMSYVPPAQKRNRNMRLEDWPTIAELVESNQRLITFLSRGADEDLVPFLLPEFDYLFETNFINDNPWEFGCDASRPWYGQHYTPNMLALVNHFLYAQFLGFRYPNATFANTTNKVHMEDDQTSCS